jgi:hypothetical protein
MATFRDRPYAQFSFLVDLGDGAAEARTAVVGSWKLLRARIVKHTSAPLNAKGTDVAMEELVLACEGLEAQSAGLTSGTAQPRGPGGADTMSR